jgi:hypothetical protein
MSGESVYATGVLQMLLGTRPWHSFQDVAQSLLFLGHRIMLWFRSDHDVVARTDMATAASKPEGTWVVHRCHRHAIPAFVS